MDAVKDVLVDEPLHVELPEHERLSARVVADVPHVFMDLAFGVALLRLVGRPVSDLDEFPPQDESVFPLQTALPGLSLPGSLPSSQKELEGGPVILTPILRGHKDTCSLLLGYIVSLSAGFLMDESPKGVEAFDMDGNPKVYAFWAL